jgi:hypothetical protein
MKVEIINKMKDINFNKWVEKPKDSHGVIRCGYTCAWSSCMYHSNILPYMTKGPFMA